MIYLAFARPIAEFGQALLVAPCGKLESILVTVSSVSTVTLSHCHTVITIGLMRSTARLHATVLHVLLEMLAWMVERC